MPKIPFANFIEEAPYGCDPDAVWTNTGDCTFTASEIHWLFMIKRSKTWTNINDPVEWAAAVTSEDVIVIPVNGKLNEPEAVTLPGKGGVTLKTATFNQGFAVKSDNPDENMRLMTKINKHHREYGWGFVYKDYRSYIPMTNEGEEYEYVHATATYSGENASREMSIKGSWSNLEMPYVFNIPIAVLP
jgi:hypothetical protein